MGSPRPASPHRSGPEAASVSISRSSRTMTTTSTSRVNRGSPRTETANPPTSANGREAARRASAIERSPVKIDSSVTLLQPLTKLFLDRSLGCFGLASAKSCSAQLDAKTHELHRLDEFFSRRGALCAFEIVATEWIHEETVGLCRAGASPCAGDQLGAVERSASSSVPPFTPSAPSEVTIASPSFSSQVNALPHASFGNTLSARSLTTGAKPSLGSG